MREKAGHLWTALQQWWQHHRASVDRESVLAQVCAEAPPSYTYVVLVVGSAAIATLGLLLDSAAVIIGAMLVAPFLGPIVALGFSIAMTDVTLALKAAKSLLLGVVLGLATAIVIVKLSPFIPPTEQILLRASPNFFDLLVAIFSGFVGAYAIIHRLAATVAGVAIATALMPPLAAAGYGLAMGEVEIFRGAFYLFLTNLVAIAMAVAATAIWYALGNLRTPRELFWPTVAAAVVLILMSVPLLQTLNQSVRTSILSRQAGTVFRQSLPSQKARLDKLQVNLAKDGTVQVEAVVFTREFDPELATRLENLLAQSLGSPVSLQLDQLLLATEGKRPEVSHLEELEAEARRLQRALSFPVASQEISLQRKSVRWRLSLEVTTSLEALLQVERALSNAFPQWRITLIPPPMALPEVSFPPGQATLDAGGQKNLAVALWALERWGARAVHVYGSAAPQEGPKRLLAALAQARAEAVAKALTEAGLDVHVASEPISWGEKELLQEKGAAALRVVRLELK